METVLAVIVLVIVYSIHHLFIREQRDEKLKNAGLAFIVKHAIAFLYLKFLRLRRQHPDYVYNKSFEDPVSLGLLPHKKQWDHELPHPFDSSSKNSDEVAFHGVNSKGACLVVYLIRRPDNFADVWLYIKLADGKCYSLPNLPTTANYVGTNNSFVAHGLKLQCLSPMRRWRITFNGLLKTSPSTNPLITMHVKFQFIWSAMSPIYDFFNDTPTNLIASATAGEKWQNNLPDIKKLRTILNKYEQCGYIMGTVAIDNKEEELYLWGTRNRSYATLRAEPSYHALHLIGVGKTGSIISVGALNIPGIISDFQYGFVTSGNGSVYPIDTSNISLFQLYADGLPPTIRYAKVNANGKLWKMQIDNIEAKTNIGTTFFSELQLSSATLNKISAQSICIFYHKLRPETLKEKHVPHFIPFLKDNEDCRDFFITALTNLSNKQLKFLGGKGVSLVRLHQIADIEKNFYVPYGIVVSFNAYQELISNQDLLAEISTLENVTWRKTNDDLRETCKRIVKFVEDYPLPVSIASSITNKLSEIFGTEFISKSFAIRSTAEGEDSDELSCAGQMETFLNIVGIDEIYKAVMKCWASQFSYRAIEYKRMNGQAINTPMAVIIQEMVKADSSGVMFTCDPVTSNPNYITISANYGLGESVVSGSSEADTISLKRNYDNQLSIFSSEIGLKKTKIVSKESGGVHEINNVEINKLCLNEDQIFQLGKIALLVEEYFGNLRDIEWAIRKNDVYLLQTRPITSVDKENDFVIKHELDGPWKSESEYITKANVGEVFPGSVSPITISATTKMLDIAGQIKAKKRKIEEGTFCPFFFRGMVIANSHVFLNLIDCLYRYNPEKASALSNSSLISLFGRILENDDEFRQRGIDRYSGNRSRMQTAWRLGYLFYDIYNSKKLLDKTMTRYADFEISVTDFNSSLELYKEICQKLHHLEEPCIAHLVCTVSSSIWNSAVLSNLAKAQNGWTTEVYADFAFLTSNINSIESASVPAAIDELTSIISKYIGKEDFQKMEINKVFSWLNNNLEISKKFQEFIKKHGHRCVKEFDIYSKTWRMDPLPLMKILQNSVGKTVKVREKQMDTKLLLNKIKSPLTKGQKRILQFVLPRCRKAVEYRETTKSLVIKVIDSFREAFNHLGQLLVNEGKLFNKEHIFFFTLEELDIFLKTRSARLLSKAISRHKIYNELDCLKFPEIIHGIPDTYYKKCLIENNGNPASIIMKGTPVSQGIVKGMARVITDIKEANSICEGEILITYSTDIGWSPYFPLISGLVTELGGLISHGAVVAREYGLPCIVGVHSASEIFHTGDIVLLDGNNGILQKIIE